MSILFSIFDEDIIVKQQKKTYNEVVFVLHQYKMYNTIYLIYNTKFYT